MNALAQIGQLAGTLYPGGIWGALECTAAVVLAVCAVAVPWQGIAAAWRTRSRNGKQAPELPPGPVPALTRDGEPLQEHERAQLDEIEKYLRTDRRMAARRRRTVRRARTGTGVRR